MRRGGGRTAGKTELQLRPGSAARLSSGGWVSQQYDVETRRWRSDLWTKARRTKRTARLHPFVRNPSASRLSVQRHLWRLRHRPTTTKPEEQTPRTCRILSRNPRFEGVELRRPLQRQTSHPPRSLSRACCRTFPMPSRSLSRVGARRRSAEQNVVVRLCTCLRHQFKSASAMDDAAPKRRIAGLWPARTLPGARLRSTGAGSQCSVSPDGFATMRSRPAALADKSLVRDRYDLGRIGGLDVSRDADAGRHPKSYIDVRPGHGRKFVQVSSRWKPSSISRRSTIPLITGDRRGRGRERQRGPARNCRRTIASGARLDRDRQFCIANFRKHQTAWSMARVRRATLRPRLQARASATLKDRKEDQLNGLTVQPVTSRSSLRSLDRDIESLIDRPRGPRAIRPLALDGGRWPCCSGPKPSDRHVPAATFP